MVQPARPGFLRHALVDPAAELTGIGGAIEAWGLALEEHTLHHAWHALPPQSADLRTKAYALAASNSDSSARRDRSAVIGAGRPMRLGARTLYQRLTPSSTARAAPRQRTRSGVIERSKWVKACSSWPSVRGSTAASPRLPRTKAPAAVALENSGRHQRPPHTPLSGRRSRSTLPSSRSATTMNTTRLRRARARRGAGSSCCRPVRRAMHFSASGQRLQRGLLRTHTVAPRSMIACVLIDPVVRGGALRELPKPPRHGALRRVARHAEVAREHPPRVAIEDRKTLSARERENRPGGRAADTGERGERVEALGELPAVLVKDVQRRAMEVAGARVVAEPGPEVQHLIHRGRGERAHIREALHEAPVIGHDGRDLGLLQHDFRHPDAIRGAVLLPGKIVSSFAGVPLEECGGDRRGAAGHPPILTRRTARAAHFRSLTCDRTAGTRRSGSSGARAPHPRRASPPACRRFHG